MVKKHFTAGHEISDPSKASIPKLDQEDQLEVTVQSELSLILCNKTKAGLPMRRKDTAVLSWVPNRPSCLGAWNLCCPLVTSYYGVYIYQYVFLCNKLNVVEDQKL